MVANFADIVKIAATSIKKPLKSQKKFKIILCIKMQYISVFLK